MVIMAFIIGFIFIEENSDTIVFVKAFTGVALLWFLCAAIQFFTNSHIIATRIAELFSLPHPFLTVVVSGAIGGIVGGTAALSGCQLRQAIFE